MIDIEKIKNGSFVFEEGHESFPISLEEYMKEEMKREYLDGFRNLQLKVF